MLENKFKYRDKSAAASSLFSEASSDNLRKPTRGSLKNIFNGGPPLETT
jgi:hypothetical protein